jgi:hypothetical protein
MIYILRSSVALRCSSKVSQAEPFAKVCSLGAPGRPSFALIKKYSAVVPAAERKHDLGLLCVRPD